MPMIISSAELRNQYAEVSNRCHETGEAIFVTKNGKGDIAILSIEAYDALIGLIKAKERVLKGYEEAEEGKLHEEPDALSQIRRKLP